MPIIKDCLACKKTMKKCAKLCADIDNFFADGDDSIGRLARFYYYVQNLEFEMFNDRPAVFNIIPFMFRRGTKVLGEGVTYRFLESIKELKSRSLMLKGTLKQPKGKSIITKVEFDDEYLDRIAKEKKVVVVNKKTSKTAIKKVAAVNPVEEEIVDEYVEPTTIVEEAPKPVVKRVRKTTTEQPAEEPVVKKTTVKKVSVNDGEGEVKKTTTTRKTSTTAKQAVPATTKKTTK